MKRNVTVTIIAFNAVLLLGWLGFELFVDHENDTTNRSRPVSAADRPADSDRSARMAVPDQGEAGDVVSEESGWRAADPGDPFDWRNAAAEAEAGGRQTKAPIAEPPDSAVARAIGSGRTSSAGNRLPERPSSRQAAPRLDQISKPARTEVPTNKQPEPVEDERRDDPSEDITPPDLEWIRFTPAEIVAGDESMISAGAVDDIAGVREIVGRISSPSGNAHLGFALSSSEGTGTWETVVRVPEKAESGRWQITWLRITDKANNARDERWGGGGSPPGSFLTVSSRDGDGEPPILHSVLLDRQTMGPGESLRVSIEVSDEISGVRFVSGTFQSPSGKAWAPFTTSGQGVVWSGPVTVPEDGECGEWTLRRVTAIDEANNQATWGTGDERIAGITFYRSFTGSCDSEPPVLMRLDLSPRVVENDSPSQIQITAFIDDPGSGVASASGFVMAADPSIGSPQRVHFVLRKSSESPGAPWIGTIEIPQHSMAGRWEIRALRISDQARNQATFGASDPAIADGWFLVE